MIAPIAEEMMFRGYLYGKLRARTNVIVAVAYDKSGVRGTAHAAQCWYRRVCAEYRAVFAA